MAKKTSSRSAKQSKSRTQGTLRTMPESRARRETLELKRTSGLRAERVLEAGLGGSRSDRAAASRMGRQPVLESQDEHPAGKGPPMTRREAAEQNARGALMKPAAARAARVTAKPASSGARRSRSGASARPAAAGASPRGRGAKSPAPPATKRRVTRSK